MKEIILYKVSVTRPTFTKEIGGCKPGGGTGGCAPDEIGM